MLLGAEECVLRGIFSSLQPENARLSRAVANHAEASGESRYPLLFDPQTAGGLLAAIPSESAPRCLEALRRLGYSEAAIVGEVVAPDDAGASIYVSKGD
jgi:selenide,water dikinase